MDASRQALGAARRIVSRVADTSWEGVAGWYDDLLKGADTYQEKVILPNLLRLIPPTGGKRVIDIACGQGFFSRAYAAGGAEVLGVDLSPELIKLARAHESRGLHFAVSSASAIKAGAGAFDAALLILALQNIKEMPETLAEAARILKPGGALAIVLNHPAFRIPSASSWGWDEATNVQYRRMDRYGTAFSIKIDMAPGAKAGVKKAYTTSFHRPLQDYVKALTKVGFSIAGLEEWISHRHSGPGPRAAAEDAARKEFPLFLAIVARKG